jgi:hypothetical protein
MPTVPSEANGNGEDQRSLLNQITGPGGLISPMKMLNAASRAAFGDRFFPMERHIKSMQEKAKQEAIQKMQAPAGLLKLPKSQNIEDIRDKSSSMPKTVGESQAYSQKVRADIKAYRTPPNEQQKFAPGERPNMKGIATEKLGLNEQEQYLYQHHLDNLEKGGVKQPGGFTSTIKDQTVDVDGKIYIIPTIWNNKAVSSDQANKNAEAVGWDKFPSYSSQKEANDRYDDMHYYMNADIQ